MNHKKAKNMEQAKLLFLGILESEKRAPLLCSYMQQLAQERQTLVNLKDGIIKTVAQQLKSFSEKKRALDLFKYQIATLDFGIAALDFEMQWYHKFF